jgi:hypothetical protein
VLFTVQDYKTRFGISGSAQDVRIDGLRRAITSVCADRLGIYLDKGADTIEFHDGDGTGLLILDVGPVSSVTSVHVDTERVFASTSLVPATDYALLREGSNILRHLTGTWGGARHSIRAAYRGGYLSVPDHIKEGAMLWGFHIVTHKPGVTSETIGAYSASYEQAAQGAVPREVKSLLGGRPRTGRAL